VQLGDRGDESLKLIFVLSPSFGKDGTAIAVPRSMPVRLERSAAPLSVDQLGRDG
jgi:hypothetical protein